MTAKASPSLMRPIAMPATGALIGTPASMRASVPPQTVAIDDESTALTDTDANVDPERAFDARFLMTLTAQALAQLRKTYAARERSELYDQLLPLLTSPPERGDLAAIAARMEMPANTLAVELKRLRERVAGAMREQLAELCVDPITADRDWQALRLGRLP